MSFNSDMTNLADAIRAKSGVTGGLTVSGMTTAVNGIVINPPSSGCDTSSVTVTADSMLSGVIAIGRNGETITGNIQTVTPSVSANVFTVSKGYVAQDAELTVPEAAVTETDSYVTIGVGYVSEELTYELGSDINFTGVNVTDDKLLEGIVAIDGVGEKVIGTIPYTQVTINRNVIDIPRGVLDNDYYNEIQLVQPVFNKDKMSLSIAEGYVYAEVFFQLRESGVVYGDNAVTVTEGYVKEDFDIPLEGGGGSGSSDGAFSFTKITEYIPYAPAITAPSSIVLSGVGFVGWYDEEYPEEAEGEDHSAANGTYTPVDAAEADLHKRQYKNGDYYFVWWKDPDYNYSGGSGWMLTKDPDGDFESSIMYMGSDENPYELGDETDSSWYNYAYEMSLDDVAVAVTTTNIPEQPLVLNGKDAESYDPATYEWTWGASGSYKGFEETPEVGSIYGVAKVSDGNFLIGSRVGFDPADLQSSALFYHDFADHTATHAVSGQELIFKSADNASATLATATKDGIPCTYNKSGQDIYAINALVPEIAPLWEHDRTFIATLYCNDGDYAWRGGNQGLIGVQSNADCNINTGSDHTSAYYSYYIVYAGDRDSNFSIDFTNVVPTGQWVQIALIQRNRMVELWYNDTLLGSKINGFTGNSSLKYVTVGVNRFNGSVVCYVSDCYGFDRALSKTELKYLWNKFSERIEK